MWELREVDRQHAIARHALHMLKGTGRALDLTHIGLHPSAQESTV